MTVTPMLDFALIYIRSAASCVIGAALLLMLAHTADGVEFAGNVLRGVERLHVVVEGVPSKFKRYGLNVEQLRRQTEHRLSAYGIEVLSQDAAFKDMSAGQLHIQLNANENAYAFYFYGISVKLKRKLPLGPDGESFTSETVWSAGRSGVINPSDLKNVYGFVDEILGQFIQEHDRQNVPSHTAL
jgi:hypothetical protein